MYSIAVGKNAGSSDGSINQNQADNSIILNSSGNFVNAKSTNSIILCATGSGFTGTTNGFFVNPVRIVNNPLNSNILTYDTITTEISYSNILNLRGSTGYTGRTGPTGPTGYTGRTGPTGPTGTASFPSATDYGSYLYYNNTSWVVGSANINLGFNSGNNQGSQSVAIGYQCGYNKQGMESVAIGSNAGFSQQGTNSIAIGMQAGSSIQAAFSIAIGSNAGFESQGTGSIAMGDSAGNVRQGIDAIAIGNSAGTTNQGKSSIAIGKNAGSNGNNTLGSYFQADNSIILNSSGNYVNAKSANSIILCATGSGFTGTTNGFFVNPIRSSTTTSNLVYNANTKEITYNGSSRRFKNNITKLDRNWDDIFLLQSCEYNFIQDNSHAIGYIAEEVSEINTEFATYGLENEPESPSGINWFNLILYQNEIIKRHNDEMKEMKDNIKNHNKEIEELKDIIKFLLTESNNKASSGLRDI